MIEKMNADNKGITRGKPYINPHPGYRINVDHQEELKKRFNPTKR